VSEGVAEFAIYGPFWTLPVGRYEMRALIVPNPQSRNRGAVVTAQVTAEKGTRLFVEGKWRLGQYELMTGTAAAEFRLPFSLGPDLPAAARTIETRIFTLGDASFRLLSLAVTAKDDEPEANWFRYLIVGECGVHTGSEIKGVKDKIGYIACTPPMRVSHGHYRVSPDMRVEAGVRGENTVAFEAWSESGLIAIGSVNSESNQPLEFDVADELSGQGVELRIRAIAPTKFSIRRLNVERVSDAIEPGSLPAVLTVTNWLPFLEPGAAGIRVGRSVVARQAQSGDVVHGPNWPLPADDYIIVFAVELDRTEKTPAATWLRPKNIIRTFLLFARILRDGSAEVVLDGRRIALEEFAIGSFFSRSTSVWLPFRIAANDVKIGSKLETRVWSSGRRSFHIRSLTVRSRKPNERIYKLRDWSIFRLIVEKIADKIRALAK
jgi:hypothetical protein